MSKTKLNLHKLSQSDILGQGSKSIVYSYTPENSQTALALKISHQSFDELSKECEALQKLQCQQGFPKLYAYSRYTSLELIENNYNWIAMQRLGETLKQRMIELKKAKNIQQIVGIALEMIDRIQIVHENGLLHLDLKPENFVFGRSPDNSERLYLIDFGMAQDQKQANFIDSPKFKGNLLYSSINSMFCRQLSVRDDLESIIYILAQMLEGNLPWQQKEIKIKDKGRNKFQHIFNRIAKMKGKSRCFWGQQHGYWIEEALMIAREQEQQKIYNKLRSWICRLIQ